MYKFVIRILVLGCVIYNLTACDATQYRTNTVETASSQPVAAKTGGLTLSTSTQPPTVYASQTQPHPIITTSKASITTRPAFTRGSWQLRWLNDIPCQLPCFEGITPGVTPGEQISNILSRDSAVNPKSVKTFSSGSLSSISWVWAEGGGGGEVYYPVGSIKAPVYSIRVSYPSDYQLKEIINKFGEPDYVFARRYLGDGAGYVYGVEFIYTLKGFLIESSDKPSQKPDLRPEMAVSDLYVFPAGSKLEYLGDSYVKGAQPWQGFKDFDYYCREEALPDKPCT